jgi:NTP pyrophosphatase (non-canonical NTP hydrolase)
VTISEMVRVSHSDAKAAGFHAQMDEADVPPRYQAMIRAGLIATEACEVLQEAKRHGVANPGRLAEELADVVIRCGDMAGTLDLDLQQAVIDKLAFNRTRGRRFGTPEAGKAVAGGA